MANKRVYNKIYTEAEYEQVNAKNKYAISDFLEEYTQRKIKPTTLKQYANNLRIFSIFVLRFCNNQNFTDLEKRDFRRLSIWLSDTLQLSNARTNSVMSAIRSMMSYFEETDDYNYDNNISKKVRGLPKEAVVDIIFLTDDQILKLKNKLLELKEYQKATLLMLAYDSAARRGELAGVEKYSFYDSLKNNTNKVVGKRGKIFPLLYFGGTQECVKLWLEQRGEDDIASLWIVENLSGKKAANREHLYTWCVSMRAILSEIEGTNINFNPHSIRHTSLTNYSNGSHYVLREMGMTQGFSLDDLKSLAHHESIETTQNYLPDDTNEKLERMFGVNIVNEQ